MSAANDPKTVADIARRDLVTLDAGMTLHEAVGILRREAVRGAPVLRGSRLVGVLSSTDILELEAAAPSGSGENRELTDWREADGVPEEDELENPSAFFFGRWEDAAAVEDLWERMRSPVRAGSDPFERHTVEEMMSRDVVTVSAGAPVQDAARRMLEHRIHRLLVVDGDELVGIVSAFDFVRLAAETPRERP